MRFFHLLTDSLEFCKHGEKSALLAVCQHQGIKKTLKIMNPAELVLPCYILYAQTITIHKCALREDDCFCPVNAVHC